MANTFLTKTKANLTAALDTVYTADTSNQTACVIVGMTFTNKTNSSKTVRCKLVTSSSSGENEDDVFLLYDVPVPAGSTFEFCQGNKIVLEANDAIQVMASAINSVDWSMSIMEITS